MSFKPYIDFRRDLHAHPELRFEEHRTAERVEEALRGLGVDEIATGLGGTGLVAVINGSRGAGPSIGMRADMDALPITEANTFSHASRFKGRMHACGHDGHTATLLAGASLLAADRDFAGRAVLIFQPAEEGGAGARAMIQDGLFDRFDCDRVYALHNWPGLPEGQFGVNPGPMMASSNQFEILVEGKGAHAAMPHLGVDPVVVAAQLITAIQTVVSRTVKPIESAVVSVTQLQAGEAINVIPNSCSLKGTVRTFSLTVLDEVEAALGRLCASLPEAFGARAHLNFERQYPPTVNDAGAAEQAAQVIRRAFGADRLQMPVEPTMGAEDFSYMLLERPGAYLFLGNGDFSGAHRESGHGLGPCSLHNPSYDFNDALIPTGARFWRELMNND